MLSIFVIEFCILEGDFKENIQREDRNKKKIYNNVDINK